MKRIEDKIEEIQLYLLEFKKIKPFDFLKYISSLEKKAACERYVEKIIESVIDLAFIIIKVKKFELPSDDKDALNILAKENIITKDTAQNIKQAKGMRNIIVHQYAKIDDKTVFKAFNNLIKDSEEFIKQIRKTYK